MNAQQTDVHERTIEYGVRALAQVKKHRTSAEPIAYELWYEHVTGQHRKLSAALKSRLEVGRISDADIRELHAHYLSSLRVSERIEQVGARAQVEMQSLLDTVQSTVGNLNGFDADLQDVVRQILQPTSGGGGLSSLLNAVIATTTKICEANRTLESHLQQSQTNISALQVALEATRGEAMTDGLTGLANRRAFDEQLTVRLGKALESGVPMSLLMLDIDHFKLFNDTHGHMVGDQVIRLVGSCIKDRLGAPDVPARFGGEEFAIISFGRDLADAVAIGEDIRSRISAYEIVRQGTQTSLGKVTVSVGAATLRAGDDALSLLERADACLFASKRAGRDRVTAEPG